ncbi:DUF5333 family protein [Jannaschia pohangensis]|uniref:Lipoprotein n=1 Tax=Jannaschia pohangensis TaxID=390807 RepID=A0A1I3Q4P8_9RHOB|nr:DUF5333 family protein [Jannaschia pohangensis]SFJ28620.1 hypothetical protein SAMN04488095_2409 [Jannaschia pohangensis]
MGFLRLASAGVLFVGLVACQPTPEAEPILTQSDIAALDTATVGFTTNLAISDIMVKECAAAGIRRKVPEEQTIDTFFAAMRAQGYSQRQITAAAERLRASGSEAVGAGVIDYLAERDVRLSDTEALCSLARREITEGSLVGNLLAPA